MSAAEYLPAALVWVAFALHLEGERRATQLTARRRDRRARWRAASFYAGLLVVLASLGPPIEPLARKLLWVHMVQHVLLIGFAAPLIVLGAPWTSIWRPLPLRFRRTVARGVALSPGMAPLRVAGRALGRPLGAMVAFSVALLAWHIPAAYDPTLRSAGIHALEHLTFMITAILLWTQVLESPPLRTHLGRAHRVFYIVGATAVGWLLSLVLAFAPTPLYSAYSHLRHRPGGVSALADQQLAAGVMLGPGSLSMTLFVFAGLYRWLDESDETRGAKRRRRAAPGATAL